MNNQHKYRNFISEIPSTAVEVYRMLPESTRCEVIFNELIMSPAPSRDHQKVSIKLTALLFQFLEENRVGELFTAPFDVYFENHDSYVQPDLFVVLNENQKIVEKNGVHGAPSLMIEIISTKQGLDTKRKPSLYQKEGVKEYFMIDPENKKTILLTLNAAGIYEQTYEENGTFRSHLLNCEIAF